MHRVAQLERIVQTLTNALPQSIRRDDTTTSYEHVNDVADGLEAPLHVIRDAGVTPGAHPDRIAHAELNVVRKGIVSEIDAMHLLVLFQRHYGRWIGWDESSPNPRSMDDVRDPLLLCVCCLIAGRHTTIYQSRARSEALSSEAKSLLGSGLLQTVQPYSFFQAALILSLWSTTAGQSPLGLDAWSISGYALQQTTVSELFSGRRLAEAGGSASRETLQVLAHLQLAHLHACVSLRRRAHLSVADIERARSIAPTGAVSNFEARMLAELHLYWTVHDCTMAEPVQLPRAQKALQQWKTEWSALFAQPRHQFLQMGFDFAQLLLYERSINAKSTNVRQSLLAEMLRLSEDILDCAINASDTRTEHLTDHVYHVITFAAITLCRLIYKYGNLLHGPPNLDQKHAIVSKTVHWLHSIGLDAHVARSMGNTIAAIHQRLFPDQQLSPWTATQGDESSTIAGVMPDFLGVDATFDWDSLLPDWQSLTSETAAYEMGQANMS